MNYYQPLQIEINGKPSGFFHYTKMNDGLAWPIGYCAEGGAEHNHQSEEEACACYKRWLLDHAEYDKELSPSSMPRCRVMGCPKYTHHAAEVDHILFALCPEHMNREKLSEVYGDVGQGCASW